MNVNKSVYLLSLRFSNYEIRKLDFELSVYESKLPSTSILWTYFLRKWCRLYKYNPAENIQILPTYSTGTTGPQMLGSFRIHSGEAHCPWNTLPSQAVSPSQPWKTTSKILPALILLGRITYSPSLSSCILACTHLNNDTYLYVQLLFSLS